MVLILIVCYRKKVENLNEQQKAVLDYKLQQQKGAAIIDGTQDSFRQDRSEERRVGKECL